MTVSPLMATELPKLSLAAPSVAVSFCCSAHVEPVRQASANELGDEREQREGQRREDPVVPPGPLHAISVPQAARANKRVELPEQGQRPARLVRRLEVDEQNALPAADAELAA